MPAILAALLLVTAACAQAQSSEQALAQLAEQGERALAAGDYAAAEQSYEQLRKLAPNTPEVLARLGLIYYQERKYEPAAGVLRQALKLKPGLPKADSLLAMALSELGRYREALPGLEKTFRSKTPDQALKRMSGLQLQRTYTGLGRDRDAVEVALEMTKAFPNDPEVTYEASRLFGNFAYLNVVKLSQIAPNSVWSHQAAGDAYESAASYDNAIREYREVVALAPNRPGIHYRIGRSLLLKSEKTSTPDQAFPEAAAEFEKELQIDPTNATAAYELGEICRKTEKLDDARKLFEAALSHYPDFEEARIALGRLLLATGKPAEALPQLRKAAAINPQNEVTYYQLSRVYGALGQSAEQEKALAEFRRLQAQKPDGEGAARVSAPREVTKQTKEE